MITVDSTVNVFANLPVLQAAARATFGASYQDCNQTQNGIAWTVYLTDPVGNQQTLWDNLVSAQDPVYLAIDKTNIVADGQDFCTIVVNAPKPGAAAVVLVITKPDGTTLTQAVTMNNGLGSVQFKTTVVGSYTISLQNPSNRSSISFTIQAG